MRKFLKFCLGIGILVLIVGGILFGVAASKKEFVEEYETKTVSLEDDFENIYLKARTSDVKFVKSTDGLTTVTYDEREKETHTITVDNNTLSVVKTFKHRWYEGLMSFNIKTPRITISLPKDTYDQLNIEISTGDTYIDDFNFNSLNIKASTGDFILKNINVENDSKISASTGDIKLENFHSNNLSVKVSTGYTYLNNTVVNENMTLKASTGDIKLVNSDANYIVIQTSTGDVTASILTPKKFEAHTSTGEVDVPNTDGNLCKVSTSTGDIRITVSNS